MAGKPCKPVARKKRPTAAQRRARADMRLLSAAWNDLAEAQRLAWDAEARTNRRGGQAARSRVRSGRRLFVKVNSRRLGLGHDLLPDPPGADSFRPTPIARFVITNRRRQIALQLILPVDQAEGVMVSSWHPCNAGVMVWKKFVRIALLTATVGGTIDLTQRYVAKYGVPPVGKKVFIRIQQMNDYMGSIVQVLSAIVPAAPSGISQPKEA